MAAAGEQQERVEVEDRRGGESSKELTPRRQKQAFCQVRGGTAKQMVFAAQTAKACRHDS